MMASTVNISHLFENNLRKVSEVGAATLNAVLSTDGDRLGQGAVYAQKGDKHIVYMIPADSICTKLYILVDEAFDAGVTATIKTISGTQKVVASALDIAVVGPTVSALEDTYFDKTDGVEIVLSKAVTKGSLRVVGEFISASTNNGIYVDLAV